MSSPVEEHRQAAPHQVRCAVLTVSDTRTLETDRGGQLLCELLASAGHDIVGRDICPDEPARMQALLQRWQSDTDIDAILLTGGTGITSRDQTYETVTALLTKELPGYGELFRWLSYQQIGTAAMLSRAVGGVMIDTVVLTMPGSPAAVRLAMESVILPELKHLVQQARQ
ncbi:MAG: MogA/MoaB family molybdenum cofactor biosynthesis protein [Planctomycetales bacterium]|nr:MogA/MoaB family molybdenum cofactor biosynthesis protein [Planctomycetales bacterium]